MVGFDNGNEKERNLDGEPVANINPNLSATADITTAATLSDNLGIGFMGSSKKAPFDIPESVAIQMIGQPNPTGLPNSDVVRPWVNGQDITRRWSEFWIIDFPPNTTLEQAARYAAPFNYSETNVKTERAKNKRAVYRERWWIHAEPRPEMRSHLVKYNRFIVTPTVSKHRIFDWQRHPFLPDQQLITFARCDDYFFGLVHSRFHETWSLAQGTQVRERESGFRYTPTSCFENFPLPRPTPAQEVAIAAAAKELNELRERWLNPPEWTETRVLEFPGSVNGPWSRYVDPKTADGKTGVGTVRYPRIEPRDADCAAKLRKRTLTNLYNERPAWLDLAHKKLDAAVAAAYGWPAELSDEQILERVLALNLERATEEAKAAKIKRPRGSRAKREDEML